MTPDVVLVVQPSVDFATFLGLSHKALGYGLSKAVDSSRLEHSQAARFLSCLAAMRDPHAPPGLTPNLLSHVSFSVFIAADERDLIYILECTQGMPFTAADTVARGVQVAVVTGTLAQWRDAVKNGCDPAADFNVRACFNKIKIIFDQNGLAIWKDLQMKHVEDKTFYLEDKRR